MVQFHIKSTLRLISKDKVLSFIKIFGLALGLMTFMLTALFSIHELKYDKQHDKIDRLYRYVHRVSTPEGTQGFAFTSATTGPALKERFHEVEAYNRIYKETVNIRNPQNSISFNETKFCFTDSNFLELFNFPLAQPTPSKNILVEPYSIVLSPSASKKYFGDESPIGKTLIVDSQIEFVVKGVFRSDMQYTHFDFDFVTSFSTLDAIKNIESLATQIPAAKFLDEKGYNIFQTYLLLSKDSDAETLQAKFPAFIEEFRGEGKSKRLKPILQSVKSIHLESNLRGEISHNGSIQSVYIFLTTGFLILLIACVNYVNISTAEFITRLKGVSLKKILGVTRASLLLSHLTETMILAVISILLGALLAYLSLPSINLLINRQLEILGPELLYLVAGILILIVLVAGIYPANSISKAGTMEAFRSTTKVSENPLSIRNVLVFFQIFTSFCLIALSGLIYDQLTFLSKKDLGFNSEQVLVINAANMSLQTRGTFKSMLTDDKEVVVIGACSIPPGEQLSSFAIALPGQTGDDERKTQVFHSYVDADYLNALGITLDEGRYYDASNPADSTQYIILNQTAANVLKGNTSSVLNTDVEFPITKIKKSVIGVVKDFNFASLHNPIEPMKLEFNPNQSLFLLVRFESKTASELLQSLQKKWKIVAPELPFDYYFLDQGFAKLYQNEQKQKAIISLFSLLAIVIASLGIFGTTLFTVQQRTKEIGIRKILGSANNGLFILLFRPIFLLITTACVIGAPLTYLIGTKWLQQFAYRIDFDPSILILSFGLILIAVMVSVIYHFQKLTRINPVEVLRQN